MRSLPPALMMCLCALVISCRVGLAQTQSPSRPVAGQEGILLLHSGRIVGGSIVRSGPGYEVTFPTGRMYLSDEQVDFAARDLSSAYLRLATRVPKDSATAHLVLARWCLTYDLLSEAAREIRQALLLEPERQDARRMLAALDRKAEAKATPNSAVIPTMTASGSQPTSASPAAAPVTLAPRTVADFTRQIQPLLMAKCGNIACHGQPERKGFALQRVFRTTTGSRRLTEANLSAVLGQLGTTVETSPITLPMRNGNGHREIFRDPVSRRQRDILLAWLRRAVAEQPQPHRPIRLVSGEQTGSAPARVPNPAPVPPPPESPLPLASDPVLDATRREIQPDAFDPNVFNNQRP